MTEPEKQVSDAVDAHLQFRGVTEALEKASRLMETLDVVLRLIEGDPHQWSSRPCQTCQAVSSLVGKPFGCNKRASR